MTEPSRTPQKALFVRLEAKPGKEVAVANFLRGGLSFIAEEPGTLSWYAFQLGPTTFGIFDTFPDDSARQAHLSGRLAAALRAQAPDLLASPPSIEPVNLLAISTP